MTSEAKKRSKIREAPDMPTGYRSTKRGAKALKAAKREQKWYRLLNTWDRRRRFATNVTIVAVQAVVALTLLVAVLAVLAYGINGLVRWNAVRIANSGDPVAEARAQLLRENVVIVAVEGDKATGFLAMRVDPEAEHVYGIAIPDGAFIEVPRTGYSRIADSWDGDGADAASAISNYLGVPFDSWVAVPASAYRDALTTMDVSALAEVVSASSMSDDELSLLRLKFNDVERDQVALVPMPVKPIKLGEQTYFEPQRDQLADLLSSWWGIDASKAAEVTRVIVYNGAGTPGIAGEAAQVLIRGGVRVVDTKNADSFSYETTLVVVKNGTQATGDRISQILGGKPEVRLEPSDQSVADVIVIIGKDYKLPSGRD